MKYSPFQAYQRYVAIKNHFTSRSYDCFKYQFKVRVTKQAFEKRNDKAFFHKLANHKDIDLFLVSLFIRNPELWIGDIARGYEEANSIYKDYLKRYNNLNMTFKNDLEKLELPADLRCTKNEHPGVLRKMLRGEVSPETVVVLDLILGVLDRWKKKLEGDVIFEMYELVLKKYTPFLPLDKKELKRILSERLEKTNGHESITGSVPVVQNLAESKENPRGLSEE